MSHAYDHDDPRNNEPDQDQCDCGRTDDHRCDTPDPEDEPTAPYSPATAALLLDGLHPSFLCPCRDCAQRETVRRLTHRHGTDGLPCGCRWCAGPARPDQLRTVLEPYSYAVRRVFQRAQDYLEENPVAEGWPDAPPMSVMLRGEWEKAQ